MKRFIVVALLVGVDVTMGINQLLALGNHVDNTFLIGTSAGAHVVDERVSVWALLMYRVVSQ